MGKYTVFLTWTKRASRSLGQIGEEPVRAQAAARAPSIAMRVELGQPLGTAHTPPGQE